MGRFKMLYITLSYFDTVLGPTTFCTVPAHPEVDIEEYTSTLLNISEFIDLKFFVYVSSSHFKTSNIYTKIPSEWARGHLEMILISIILVDEEFNRLFIFEEVLEKIVAAIDKMDKAYMAFYSEHKDRTEVDVISSKKEELVKVLNEFVPEVQEIIEAAKRIPTDSEVIETEEDLQDEFIILDKTETVLEAAHKLASSPRILIGCVIEDNKPIGIIDEDDVLKKVILQEKDPLLVKVEDIMTKDVVMVDSNDPIGDTVDLMIDKGIQAVPILQDGEFFGVFTIFDAAHHNKNVIELIGEHLQDISGRKLEDVKKLKLKLWSYIRNISRNRRLQQLQK